MRAKQAEQVLAVGEAKAAAESARKRVENLRAELREAEAEYAAAVERLDAARHALIETV